MGVRVDGSLPNDERQLVDALLRHRHLCFQRVDALVQLLEAPFRFGDRVGRRIGGRLRVSERPARDVELAGGAGTVRSAIGAAPACAIIKNAKMMTTGARRGRRIKRVSRAEAFGAR